MAEQHKTAADAAEPPLGEEAAAVVEEYIPGPAELAVADPSDRHEVMLAMDEHDVRLLLERAQSSALRKWIYVLPDGTKGLTVHAVQDLVQQMNWSRKCRIGVLHESAKFTRTVEDAGYGEEPFWTVDVAARDDVSGQVWMGTSSEPVYMRLKPSTAKARREKGASIPDDNRVFDPFSRSKALQKAQRNAMGSFIPEQVEQTIIAMFEKDPARVEHIRTEAEAKLAELPPALEDDEAKALIAQARAAYAEITWPAARVEFPPAKFAAWLLHTQHSHESLKDLVVMVKAERDRLAGIYGGES